MKQSSYTVETFLENLETGMEYFWTLIFLFITLEIPLQLTSLKYSLNKIEPHIKHPWNIHEAIIPTLKKTFKILKFPYHSLKTSLKYSWNSNTPFSLKHSSFLETPLKLPWNRLVFLDHSLFLESTFSIIWNMATNIHTLIGSLLTCVLRSGSF